MLKGKTKSGFRFEIADEVLDDWELFEMLSKIDGGNIARLPEAIVSMLGERQYNNLKNFIRKRDGKVSVNAMLEEFGEIMNANNKSKNC